MDPKKIKRDLQQADAHIRSGAAEVEKQRRIVKSLEIGDHDTRIARVLLRTIEELQATHVTGRATIAQEFVLAEKEYARMADDKV